MVPSKHNIFIHLTKDWKCDICLRTKITRASCRRRTGTVVTRAQNFGDFRSADHKVLSEECESRHNHRYAVVAQDLATQWIQSHPCKKKKLLRKQKRDYKRSQSRQGNQKSFTLKKPWNLGRPVKN